MSFYSFRIVRCLQIPRKRKRSKMLTFSFFSPNVLLTIKITRTMKQLLLSILFLLVPVAASADAVEINGIYYNLITKGGIAEVTSNPNKYSGEVVIPESVEYEGATYSVTSIGKHAFSVCRGLTSVIIPNSVTNIGYGSFNSCSGLISVIIPNSVNSIDQSAFSGCI